MITAFIKGQAIETPETVIVAESLNYLKAQFVFVTNDWNGLEKTAYFTQDETTHPIKLDENNIAYPLHLSTGEWAVSVAGREYKNGELVERITTDTATINVKPFKAGAETPFPEPTPTEIEALKAEMGNLPDLATDDKTSLVNAINEVYENKGSNGGGLTEEQASEISKNTENRHWHDNKNILDLFGINNALVRPTFNGARNVLATQEDITDKLTYYATKSSVPNFASVDGSILKMQRKEANKTTDLFSVELPASGSGGGSGADGFSPIVNVKKIEGGYRVTITDAEGEKSFDIFDGVDGEPYVLTESDKEEIKNAVIEEISVGVTASLENASIETDTDGNGIVVAGGEAVT